MVKNYLEKLFLKEPLPLTSKRDLNWPVLKKVAAGAIALVILGLLLMPSSKEEKAFHEKVETEQTSAPVPAPSSVPQDAFAQMQSPPATVAEVPSSTPEAPVLSIPERSEPRRVSSGSGRGGSYGGGVSIPIFSPPLPTRNQNSPMILTRTGMDSRTQLSPGSRIPVRLLQGAIVASQAMPIIAVVSRDVVQEDSLAIPKDSKLFGELAFDDDSERAMVAWRTIQLPDGRSRQISALGLGLDGQVGVNGKVHSDAFKNTVGQTLTRFIGAYAEGSMQRGAFGANDGGHANGLRNAVAETAKDRAEAWAEDMKKERKWIELPAGTEFDTVVTQPFTYRDPGAYGQ